MSWNMNPSAFCALTQSASAVFRYHNIYTNNSLHVLNLTNYKPFLQDNVQTPSFCLTCPVCEKVCELPAGDPTTLPTNVYAVHMIQVNNEKKAAAQ